MTVQPLPTLNFLIVDPWHVVAMDLEHLLAESCQCTSRIIHPDELEATLKDVGFFDCIFYDTGPQHDASALALQGFQMNKSKLVFTATDEFKLVNGKDYELVPVLTKPYIREKVISTLAAILSTTEAQPHGA